MSSIKASFFLFSCNIQLVLLYNSSLKACCKWNARCLASEVNISCRAALHFCKIFRKSFPFYSACLHSENRLDVRCLGHFSLNRWLRGIILFQNCWLEYKLMILQVQELHSNLVYWIISLQSEQAVDLLQQSLNSNPPPRPHVPGRTFNSSKDPVHWQHVLLLSWGLLQWWQKWAIRS